MKEQSILLALRYQLAALGYPESVIDSQDDVILNFAKMLIASSDIVNQPKTLKTTPARTESDDTYKYYMYINNPDAFLFDNKSKYTTNNSLFGQNQFVIYQSALIGPTFGAGHDFLTLSQSSPKILSNNVFTFLNNNTGPLGASIRSYNNYELSDLEVYLILY